jgi:hypothetical protein
MRFCGSSRMRSHGCSRCLKRAAVKAAAAVEVSRASTGSLMLSCWCPPVLVALSPPHPFCGAFSEQLASGVY